MRRNNYKATRYCEKNGTRSPKTWSPQEFLVNPTNLDVEAWYISDCCVNRTYCNLTFVMNPVHERAAVETLRDAYEG